MTNDTTFYRWTKIKNGIGSVALVTVDVEPNSFETNQILEHYSGQGFTSQGDIEEVPEIGYDSWKIAARHGLEYAFSLIDTYWTVHINKIEGRIATDCLVLKIVDSFLLLILRQVYDLFQVLQ